MRARFLRRTRSQKAVMHDVKDIHLTENTVTEKSNEMKCYIRHGYLRDLKQLVDEPQTGTVLLID